MTDYTKTTDFTAKDSLPSGNANKVVKGAEFDTEFDNIATAVSTKFDNASTVDINGGAIDGTTIGASTPAAGTFTTFTSTGIDDNSNANAITIDSSERVGFNATSPSVEVHIRDQNYGTLSNSTPVLRIDSNSSLASNSKIELKAGSGTASIFRYSASSDNYLAIEETGTGGTSGIRINDADLGVGLFTAGSSSSPDFKVDTSGDVTVANDMTVAGTVVKLTGLPTSDPASAGQLWNDSGTLKVSAG